ncbi:MAG: homoserine dehydrogenase [Nitrosopumilales archaeon]|nr:homoserine dehydrogenase [Nitrosopumilales archaeon]
MRLVVIGFGVVGQSFARLLLSRSADLYRLYGVNPRIVACIDSGGYAVSATGLDLQRLLNAKKLSGTVGAYDKENRKFDPLRLIEKVDAEMLLELTPTNLDNGEPGISNIIAAMKSGKHVITVNKGPLALAFPSLLELANYNNIKLRFSGTVGGGTPILEFAKRCLKGDSIISFQGILNGTTNYILSKMEEGLTFEDALNDAKYKGYAETVPFLDAIKDVNRRGITGVSLSDVRRAHKRGNAIKLIAICNNKQLDVKPTELSNVDPICVNGTLNAVTFSSEQSGEHTIIGQGAGGIPTASAVLRDLIDIRNTIFEQRENL